MTIKSMNKKIMVYLCIDILYSSEKTKSMNLPKKNAAQKKPEKKKFSSCDSICIRFKRWQPNP